MIVYSGKQFWNDFNNWDEGLFQDANRPRDEDKFKLRPWLQSDKWKWREANKDTDFSHIMIKWGCTVPWTWSWKQLLWTVPKIQTTWTQSELDALWVPTAFMANVTPEVMNMEKENNPFVLVKKWKITYLTWDGSTGFTTNTVDTTYLEIAESWLYYILCWGKFCFDLNSYNSNTSYQYKEWVWLWQNMNWVFTNTDMTQQRACGNWDMVRFIEVAWFPKWDQIIPMIAHSYTTWTNTAFGGIEVVRLW